MDLPRLRLRTLLIAAAVAGLTVIALLATPPRYYGVASIVLGLPTIVWGLLLWRRTRPRDIRDDSSDRMPPGTSLETDPPMGGRLRAGVRIRTPEQFRKYCRKKFRFLFEEFGFAEKPLAGWDPAKEFMLRLSNGRTIVTLHGICFGHAASVELARAGSIQDEFSPYPFDDLLALRRPEWSPSRVIHFLSVWPGDSSPDQAGYLAHYAEALRTCAADVLRGDHSVFPAVAEEGRRHREEFMSRLRGGEFGPSRREGPPESTAPTDHPGPDL